MLFTCGLISLAVVGLWLWPMTVSLLTMKYARRYTTPNVRSRAMEKIEIGGRFVMVEPKFAATIRKRQSELAAQSRRVSLELRESRLLPSGSVRSMAPHTDAGTFVQPLRTYDNKAEWAESKKDRIAVRASRIFG